MKSNTRILAAVASLASLPFATSCSQKGLGGGGTTASGGTIGSGGTTGGAGAMGSGATNGTGGTGATAGTGAPTGSGGAIGAGGTVGGGSGGAPGTGGRAVTTGTGGSTGAGGTTGSGGATGAAGAGSCPTIDTLVPGLDGYYWQATPSGNTVLAGTNYPFGPSAGGCPSSSSWDTRGYINTEPTLNIKGTAGQKYTININVRGVAGTRCYTNGTPGPGATTKPDPSGPNNTWYIGGQEYNQSEWNTYEIHVAPKVPGGVDQVNSVYDVYFANSFPNVSGWCEMEATYQILYNASFSVLGGGTISFVIHDSNCRTLENCGQVPSQSACDTSASRIIDMSGVSPAPVNFAQPRTASLGGTTYYVQWLWIDVTSVSCQ